MARYTIDRFEGDAWAVLEDERAVTFRVPRRWVPAEAQEGDVLNAFEGDVTPAAQSLHLEIDPKGRKERDAEAKRLRNELPRGPKGDVSL